jgi:pimeloyl-ACP methyl ester carboxylesterase
MNTHQMTVTAQSTPISTTYLTAGEGPPLLLIHGLGDSSRSWEELISYLSQNYTVYAPDLPGFGTSEKPPIEYSPELFTAFIEAFLDALGLERVAIVGNSLGGLIALRLAFAQPERVAALGLIASAGLGHDVNFSLCTLTLPPVKHLLSTWNRTYPGAWQWAMSISLTLFGFSARIPPYWFRQMYDMALMPGYSEALVSTARSLMTLYGQRDSVVMLDDLHRLHVPTQIIWGANDRILPVYQAEMAGERLPNGHVTFIPDCGHVVHAECPERVSNTLTPFLAEHTAH